MFLRKKSRGFTLIEILFVIVIIGIIAAIVLPRLTYTAEEAKKNACKANKSNINTQVERWYFDKGDWPANDLSDIGDDDDYFPDGIPACPVDDSSYELDPLKHRVTGHTHP